MALVRSVSSHTVVMAYQIICNISEFVSLSGVRFRIAQSQRYFAGHELGILGLDIL